MRLRLPFNHGILGINARNLLYIKPFNPKKSIALADDKLRTKAFLMARGIPGAKIYARIESREQLREFDFKILPDECVLKPNLGFGGEGIIILKGRKKGMFLRNGKTPMSNDELFSHIEDILDGKFSLGGRRDNAFFEQILTPHECFAPFRAVGLPDIRVIVFNLIPVMAMLRIPTVESDGKANVHLGGIGIGIDIVKGVTTHAAQYHSMIHTLPHGISPSGISIPHWDEILLICTRIQHITNIGYLAVDIVIDKNMGPGVLEVNARAGLMVQIANLIPLRSRLELVKGLHVTSPEHGVQICHNLFGSKGKKPAQEKEVVRPILGTDEILYVTGSGTTIEVHAIIAPEKKKTIFSTELISQLVEKGALELESAEEQSYRIKFTLGGKKIQTLVYAGVVPSETYQAMISRRDLKDFLIDPAKRTKKLSRRSEVKTDLRAVDNLLAGLDKDLLFIKYLKPLNLEEERQRLLTDTKYNPIFLYPKMDIDLHDAKKRLAKSVQDDSPLGILLEKKRIALQKRIALLENRGKQEEFTRASKELFGEPTSALMKAAETVLQNRTQCDIDDRMMRTIDSKEAKSIFDAVLESYGLHNWTVSIRSRLVADCTVGGQNIYIRQSATFSKQHIASLIAHEIETHVLTAENGEHQSYQIFRRGFANYLDTQEGLAIYNQNRILSIGDERRFNAPRILLAHVFSLHHSLAETRAFLTEELGYHPEKALTQSITMKRGLTDTSSQGGFTKSVVYFRGLRAVEKFIENGGDLRRLYVGKISLEDLEFVEKIPDIQKPLLIPKFLLEQTTKRTKK